jgi:hypothetical protein
VVWDKSKVSAPIKFCTHLHRWLQELIGLRRCWYFLLTNSINKRYFEVKKNIYAAVGVFFSPTVLIKNKRYFEVKKNICKVLNRITEH